MITISLGDFPYEYITHHTKVGSYCHEFVITCPMNFINDDFTKDYHFQLPFNISYENNLLKVEVVKCWPNDTLYATSQYKDDHMTCLRNIYLNHTVHCEHRQELLKIYVTPIYPLDTVKDVILQQIITNDNTLYYYLVPKYL